LAVALADVMDSQFLTGSDPSPHAKQAPARSESHRGGVASGGDRRALDRWVYTDARGLHGTDREGTATIRSLGSDCPELWTALFLLLFVLFLPLYLVAERGHGGVEARWGELVLAARPRRPTSSVLPLDLHTTN
jgi:hypothetical protein